MGRSGNGALLFIIYFWEIKFSFFILSAVNSIKMKKKIDQVATGRTGNPVILSLDYAQAKKKMNLFEGQTRAEYEAKIKAMSNCDLSNYASKIGLRPSGERRMLTLGMMKAYDDAARSVERYSDQSFAVASPETREINENFEKFISTFKS